MADKKSIQLVKVYVRQRPFSKNELEIRSPSIIRRITSRDITVSNHKSGHQDKKYSYDEVFGDRTSQSEIYKVVVSPLIDCIITGYNCTVFAYGQTGTGKTHTMIGNFTENSTSLTANPDLGMIPRAAHDLFAKIGAIQPHIEHTVRVSFIEIYNEEVRDLLALDTGSDSPPLRIYEDKGTVIIPNLTELTVCNVKDVYDHLIQGTDVRKTAATNLNRQSSRSHTVFTLILHSRETTADGEEIIKTGKLHLVDLAGSENIGRSGATEMRAREAGTINKSLLTLGKVIKALSQKGIHIPYRDSKLTRILQDSLGGKTKTCMIATISPAVNAFDETVSTLEYASVARNVANCPTVNINRKQANLVKDLTEEINKLRRELTASRTGEGFFISPEHYMKLNTDLEEKTTQVLDLLQRIEHMEEYNRLKSEEYEKILDSFEQTRSRMQLELQEEKLKAQQNDFMLKYVSKQGDKLRSTANNLMGICQVATKHEQIYYNKYKTVFEKTVHNSGLSKHLCGFMKRCIEEMKQATCTFQNSHVGSLMAAHEMIDVVENMNGNDSHELMNILAILNESYGNDHLTFEDLFKTTDYNLNEEFLRSFFGQLFRTSLDEGLEHLNIIKANIHQLLDYSSKNFKRNEDEATNVMCYLDDVLSQESALIGENSSFLNFLDTGLDKKKERVRLAEEKHKQMEDEINKIMEQLKATQATQIEAKNNLLLEKEQIEIDSERVGNFRESIDSYNKTRKLPQLQQMLHEHHKSVTHVNNAKEIQLKQLNSEIEKIQEMQKKSNEIKNQKTIEIIEKQSEVVASNVLKHNECYKEEMEELIEKTSNLNKNVLSLKDHIVAVGIKITGTIDETGDFTDSSNHFYRKTLEQVQNVESDWVTVAPSGDTPNQKKYVLPKRIPNRLPQEVLLEKFQETNGNVDLLNTTPIELSDTLDVDSEMQSSPDLPNTSDL